MSDTINPGRSIFDDLPAVRIYHTRVQLSTQKLPVLSKSAEEITHVLYLQEQRAIHSRIHLIAAGVRDGLHTEQQEEEPHQIVQLIRALPGVEHVAPFAYNLIVVKAKMYEWEEIEPAVARIIKLFQAPLPSID